MSHLLTSLTILLSVLALVGWNFNINILSRPVSGTAAMNPLTAICFILSGFSLILLKCFGRPRYLKILGIILASLVLTLSVVVLGELVFDSNIRIDTWLFYSKMDSGVEGSTLNYMSPNTAICFILTSVALLMFNNSTRIKWFSSEFLALFVGIVAITKLIGYLYSVEAFYAIFKYFPMSIYTAIGFLIITLAILFSNKRNEFIAEFLVSNIESSIARKLLPAAIILPISLGLIRLYLEDNGFISDELGAGLLVACNIGIFIIIIWIYALELNKKDVLKKSAELINIETSNRLRLATQAGNIGVWELDVVENKLLWDNQMCALYGLTTDTFTGDYEAWRKTIHPDDAERSQKELQASIHEGKVYSSEFRVVWLDGSIKTIKANANIERNKEGKALRFVGVNWDISEIKKAEERIKKSETRFRSLFENAPESITVLDLASGKFINTNKNASNLFKLSAEKFTELGLVEISPKFQPDGRLSTEKAKEYLEKAMMGDKVFFEWMHCDANKEEIMCEVHLTLLPSTRNPIVYASIVDITERNETREKLKQQFNELVFQNEEKEKRAAELIIANKELLFQNEEKEKRAAELNISNTELKKANNELDRFVYSTSHDLRSPLKSLLGLSDLIIDDISTDNIVQLRHMDMMKSSIIKLDNFIEDILNYSRNARTEIAKEAIDFKDTIQDITSKLILMEGAKEIKLNVKIDQNLKFITDMGRVNVVLNNMIYNAFKYKDPFKENSFVTINIKCSNEQAIISIEDNGIGIDPKNKEKIFEMFYRATKMSTGSGLGLYIVKETLEKLNGTIKMESKLTKGTKFIITLPNQLFALN